MYFHLIGIKEKVWKQYDLDILLNWWDELFIRDFLAHRWVVIVSLSEYKEDPNSFGNITIKTIYNDIEIQILTNWEDLKEKIYTMIFIGLQPQSANFIENPIPAEESQALLQDIFLQIEEENKKIKQDEEDKIQKEQKIYEESSIKSALKIINSCIDRIEQVTKIWWGIVSMTELKTLDNYLNEMKKIRLWTNFNKMANLVLDADILLKKAEKEIIEANKDKNFSILKNSSITNIDILNETLHYDKINHKTVFMPKTLSATESISSMLWSSSIFLNLLRYDFISNVKNLSLDMLLDIIMQLIEYIVLTATVVLCIAWIIMISMWSHQLSLYFLPAFGWLWLLVYLFNNLYLKWASTKILGFIVLVIIYWRGLILLHNTFSL